MRESTAEIMTEIDHIAVAAHTLAQGVEYVRACLGIEMPYGGAHPRMGTHNHLVRLGPAVFLEVIAVDPAAPAPARPRWFGLDDPALQAELAAAPRLLTWVVRTGDIAGALLACSRPLGAIQPMTRGELRWLITFPDDGTMVDGGAMPALIHWHGPGEHPAGRMLAGPVPMDQRRHRAAIYHRPVVGERNQPAQLAARHRLDRAQRPAARQQCAGDVAGAHHPRQEPRRGGELRL